MGQMSPLEPGSEQARIGCWWWFGGGGSLLSKDLTFLVSWFWFGVFWCLLVRCLVLRRCYSSPCYFLLVRNEQKEAETERNGVLFWWCWRRRRRVVVQWKKGEKRGFFF